MLFATPLMRFPMAKSTYDRSSSGLRPKMLLSFPYRGCVAHIDNMYPVKSHDALSRLLNSDEIRPYVARTRDVSALAIKTPDAIVSQVRRVLDQLGTYRSVELIELPGILVCPC